MQIPLLIATATEDLGHSHSVWDALPHLGGMLMVLITLFILWGITAAVAKIVAIIHARQAPANSPAPTTAKTSAATPTGTPPSSDVPVAAIAVAVAEHYANSVRPEIAAVIAAAVTCMSGGTRRVISIKPVDMGWEKAGRQAVLYSHRIR